MQQCPQCEGFLPHSMASAYAEVECIHCGFGFQSPTKRHTSRAFKRVGQLVLGASAALTLSACYGAPPPASLPPCDDTNTSEPATSADGEETPSASPTAPCATPTPESYGENDGDNEESADTSL